MADSPTLTRAQMRELQRALKTDLAEDVKATRDDVQRIHAANPAQSAQRRKAMAEQGALDSRTPAQLIPILLENDR